MMLQNCKAFARIALLAVVAAPALAVAAPSVETLPCHGAPSLYKVLVTTEGVKNNHGYLVANLYGPDRRRWLAGNGWLDVWRDTALRGDETMCFYVPAPGRYPVDPTARRYSVASASPCRALGRQGQGWQHAAHRVGERPGADLQLSG